MEERLPPACAFAISVLAEYEQDPEAVPEEAVEAAQQHMVTCARCKDASNTQTIPTATPTPRKRKKARRPAESNGIGPLSLQALLDETTPLPNEREASVGLQTPPQEPGHTETALQTTTKLA